MLKVFSFMAVIIFYTGICFSQDTSRQKDSFEQMDIQDWITRHRPGKNKPANSFLVLIPVVCSNPTAGLMYGVGLSYTYKTFSTDQKLSTIGGNSSYSTKGLLNLSLRSNVFTGHEKWIWSGDWRYLSNTETTYGLGTRGGSSANLHLNGYGIAKDALGQSLKYRHLRLHETVSKKLMPNFFAGFGFRYDYFSSIKDELTVVGDSTGSYQYQYSSKHGFNPAKYATSGISFNLIFDTRDNEVNAYNGYYANINYSVNTKAMGSSANSNSLLTEYRAFYSLDRKKRNILAFWLYGNFSITGTLPYLALPALGYDERQETGRGYTFGRFRGENLLYAESEYRFPVSANSGILGGVLFLNLTSVSDKANNVHLLNALRAGYGTGLRIMLDKRSRTRLEVDAGIGQKTVGLYFGVQEAF